MQAGLLKTLGGGAKINFSNHFSRKFGLNISGHEDISFVDIDLTTDVTLYIDPTLIELVDHHWSNEAESVINDFFTNVFESCRQKEYERLYELVAHGGEPNETKLGQSTGQSRGKGTRPENLFNIFRSISVQQLAEKAIIKKPAELAIFVRNFAEDRMSDLVTNVIRRQLSDFTIEQCRKHGIKLESDKQEIGMYWHVGSKRWEKLVDYPLVVDGRRILLVPKTIVRRSHILSAQQYISKFVLEYYQDYHFKNRTELCETGYYKDGREYVKPPGKDELRSRMLAGMDGKEFLWEFSKEHPDLVAQFRETDITTKNYRYFVPSDRDLDKWVYEKRQKDAAS